MFRLQPPRHMRPITIVVPFVAGGALDGSGAF
jgi:tripartite-type tricarboxylate transporter receptor subunit TctC